MRALEGGATQDVPHSFRSVREDVILPYLKTQLKCKLVHIIGYRQVHVGNANATVATVVAESPFSSAGPGAQQEASLPSKHIIKSAIQGPCSAKTAKPHVAVPIWLLLNHAQEVCCDLTAIQDVFDWQLA